MNINTIIYIRPVFFHLGGYEISLSQVFSHGALVLVGSAPQLPAGQIDRVEMKDRVESRVRLDLPPFLHEPIAREIRRGILALFIQPDCPCPSLSILVCPSDRACPSDSVSPCPSQSLPVFFPPVSYSVSVRIFPSQSFFP